MRNLTIKREKSFVGCLVPMKVYIEDPESWELKIHGTPCRKVGEIKNGAELTISIEEHSLRVYVIGDKMSKEFCYDVYMLPEGDEDVYLSGNTEDTMLTFPYEVKHNKAEFLTQFENI